MKKIEEYLEYAAECREMAGTASPAHRRKLEQMAQTWEQLAAQRPLEKLSDTSWSKWPKPGSS